MVFALILLSLVMGTKPVKASASENVFWPLSSPESLPLVNCRWEDAEQTILLVEGEEYVVRVATNPVRILGVEMGGEQLLEETAIAFQFRDESGRFYAPDSQSKARWNVWRCGQYYWDAHLLEIPFVDENGERVAEGEIVFHIHADRVHIEFLITPQREELFSIAAVLTCGTRQGNPQSVGDRPVLSLKSEDASAWVLGTDDAQFSNNGTIWTSPMLQKESRVGTYWVLKPGDSQTDPQQIFHEQIRPLTAKNFTVKNGRFVRYDPAAGFYEVVCTTGLTPGGFESWYRNPGRRFSSDITLKSSENRNVLIRYSSASAGTVEASLLTDASGFPYPMVVQTCKNFGGEMEEPDDTPFSESYFPVALKAGSKTAFTVHHLFQNWGNHPLTQFSSIRFFTIYWHLSTGVTETTCYALNPMPSNCPGGTRYYTIADYRPMSGIMWPGQPQHHHVALQGFLQYLTAEGQQKIVYENTITHSTAPNLAHFTMNYHTTDDAARCSIEAFEIPQLDETRAFVRIRYDFDRAVEIQGDARLNFRLLNKGTYIRRVRFPKVSWLDEQGSIQTREIEYNSQPTLLGEMLGGEFPFACLYPHDDGNDSVIVRSYSARLGGKTYTAPAVSTTGYAEGAKDDRALCEMALTVPEEKLTIQPGDFVEAELILMPYGDSGSSWHAPNLERLYYGTNPPQVTVSHGAKIADFPTTVAAHDDVASFSLSGGFDYVPLIVQGFGQWKTPLLWEGTTWINQQLNGGDGYQVQLHGEGGYQFTFVFPTRRDQTHSFHVTLAECSTGISAMYDDNGDVVLESSRVGEFSLKAPLLFTPGTNTITKGTPIHSFSGKARRIRSARVTCAPNSNVFRVDIVKYTDADVVVKVESGAGRLNFHRLPARTLYRVTADERSWDEATSPGGDLSVSVSNPGTVRLKRLSDQDTIPPVQELTAKAEEGIVLRWRPNWASAVTGYEIVRRCGDNDWEPLAKLKGQRAEYFDTALQLHTTYEYRVGAIGNSGQDSAFGEPVSVEAPSQVRIYDFVENFEQSQIIKPDDSPRVHTGGFTVGGVLEKAIFAHPDSGDQEVVVRYQLQLPEGVKAITGFTGIRDGAEITDGVDFEVRINGISVWQMIHDKPHWMAFRIDISKYTGSATVEFLTRKGPDNSRYDWACWGEPVVLLGE